MPSRFKDRTLRNTYEAMVASYRNRSLVLFTLDGTPTHGNGYANNFWRGYDNVQMTWDAYSKTTPSYACYRAGRDIAKKESK